MILFYIIGATISIGLLSLVGALLIFKSPVTLDKLIFNLVGLSTGTLLGGAFFHLIPESLEKNSTTFVFGIVLLSFCLFFLIEKLLHWHHCHRGVCEKHSLGYINLLGDLIHNFIDGVIVASAFLVEANLGIITTLALAVHEIPQELGDLGVLLYSGFSKRTALLANFLVSLSALMGGICGYFLLGNFSHFINYLMPFAAGAFLYISSTDLIPELKNESNLTKSMFSFLLFVLGLYIMFVL